MIALSYNNHIPPCTGIIDNPLAFECYEPLLCCIWKGYLRQNRQPSCQLTSESFWNTMHYPCQVRLICSDFEMMPQWIVTIMLQEHLLTIRFGLYNNLSFSWELGGGGGGGGFTGIWNCSPHPVLYLTQFCSYCKISCIGIDNEMIFRIWKIQNMGTSHCFPQLLKSHLYDYHSMSISSLGHQSTHTKRLHDHQVP